MDYDLVYADPPWKQTKGGKRNVRPRQGKDLDYPTLDLEDIFSILQNFDSKVLFLWTIDKYLFEAQSVAEKLGYKLHARFIWNKKNGIAPAFTVRFCHEYLLWMYKSPMLKIEKSQRGKFSSVLEERATKHSAKPLIAYEMIEKMYPSAKKIELFARKKRDGWDCWGNEVDF